MKARINIVTAVSRPENIWVMKENISNEILPYFSVMWYLIYDIGKGLDKITHKESWIKVLEGGVPNDCAGGSQRNIALDMIRAGWIYFLDDDNLMYEGFGKYMSGQIKSNPLVSGFLFNQDREQGRLRADKIGVNYIDTAQILLKAELIDNLRFEDNNYGSDGILIGNIYDKNKDKFMLIDKTLCYYNKLRPSSQ